jgi:UDP-glucose 4-epimerase
VGYPAARNQVFNVGADVPYTVNDLAEVVAEAMGKECRTAHLDPRKEVKVAFSDHRKAEAVFGAREKTSLKVGVGAMAAWVENHGARESSVFEDIEVSKNLPPSWATVARVSVCPTTCAAP